MLQLLSKPSFRALTASQFLGAFNDNAFKQLVLLIVVSLATADPIEWAAESRLASVGQSLPATLFALPFVMFGALTGSLADRVSKTRVIRAANLLEIAVMGLGCVAFVLESYDLLMLVVFLMGTQSAIFGPAKYGSIQELVGTRALSRGNALIQTTTMIAILVGVMLGGQLLKHWHDALWIPGLMYIGFATLGWWFSLGIERLPVADPRRRLDWNVAAEVWRHAKATEGDRVLILSIIASAFFYFVGATLLLVVNRYGAWLGLDAAATAALNGMTVLGIAGGALLAGRVSGDRIESGLVPIGLFGLAASMLLVMLEPGSATLLRGLLFMAGVSAGLFSIPIRALIQARPRDQRRGAILGLSEMTDFIGILSAGGAYYLLEGVLHLSPPTMCVVMGVVVALFTLASLAFTAEFAVRLGLLVLVHTLYRIETRGLERIPRTGGALIVANHTSFVDALLIGAVAPRPVRFLMHRSYFELRGVGWFARRMGAIPVAAEDGSAAKRAALEEAVAAARSGALVGIFAEGRITRTGALLPFATGLERIAASAGVPIVPLALDRLWGSVFSFRGGRFFRKLPRRLPYRVDLTVAEPLPATTPAWRVREAIQEATADRRSQRDGRRGSLAWRFVRSAKTHARGTAVVDSTGTRLSYAELLVRALVLRAMLRARLEGSERVGVMLPPSAAGVLVNVALPLAGKVAVNVNYTLSDQRVARMLERASATRLITSRRFLEALGRSSPLGEGRTIYVEDLRREAGPAAKLRAWLVSRLPAPLLARLVVPQRSAREPLSVLFSSGSTAEPKGIVLSHGNVLSNVQGVLEMLSIGPEDTLLGVLPFFHSFGGTVTLWTTLLSGAKGAYHANPLDAKAVVKLCREERVSIAVGTPAFYQAWMRRARPEDFRTLRIALCGAEKLPAALARAFEQRFGLPLLEGYGCTELSPAVSFNVPDVPGVGGPQRGHKPGTIGRPLPGVAVRIVDVATRERLPIGCEGVLEVKGPNVMQGYLDDPDATAAAIRDGWYSTGDVAKLDGDGFLVITDRLSRFSKIGGEMVPHGGVEEALREAAERLAGGEPPELAVTSLPDERRGERLVVVHTPLPFPVSSLLEALAACDLPALFRPRADSFVEVEEIPRLGTGKLDLAGLRVAARAALAPET